MRSVLLAILIAAVFSPSLMCGMDMCAMPAHAIETGSDKPCQDHEGQDRGGGVMMLKDCIGLDLMPGKAFADMPAPDIDTIAFAYPVADVAGLPLAAMPGAKAIRGPPESGRRHASQPLTLLITQRFRI